jgi:hypothetical protein
MVHGGACLTSGNWAGISGQTQHNTKYPAKTALCFAQSSDYF